MAGPRPSRPHALPRYPLHPMWGAAAGQLVLNAEANALRAPSGHWGDDDGKEKGKTHNKAFNDRVKTEMPTSTDERR